VAKGVVCWDKVETGPIGRCKRRGDWAGFIRNSGNVVALVFIAARLESMPRARSPFPLSTPLRPLPACKSILIVAEEQGAALHVISSEHIE